MIRHWRNDAWFLQDRDTRIQKLPVRSLNIGNSK